MKKKISVLAPKGKVSVSGTRPNLPNLPKTSENKYDFTEVYQDEVIHILLAVQKMLELEKLEPSRFHYKVLSLLAPITDQLDVLIRTIFATTNPEYLKMYAHDEVYISLKKSILGGLEFVKAVKLLPRKNRATKESLKK